MTEVEVKQLPQPREGKCHFWIPRKYKHCTGTVDPKHGGDGATYCSIHKKDAEMRVPCPLNPKHDVKASEVERHIAVCPDGRTAVSPYFTEHVNVVAPHLGSASSAGRFQQASPEEQRCFLDWLESAYRTMKEDALHIRKSRESHPHLALYLTEGQRKHRLQEAALVHLLSQQMDKFGKGSSSDSEQGNTFHCIEVGAGKAGLSCALHVAFPSAPITLVERAKFRDPKEKLLNNLHRRRLRDDDDHDGGEETTTAVAAPVERVRLDARHFDVGKWIQGRCSSASDRVAVVGKHLCGGCSDMALHIATSSLNAPPRPRSTAIVLATCCHHLCTPDTYVGMHERVPSPSPSGGTVSALLFPSLAYFQMCVSVCSWANIHSHAGDHAAEPTSSDDPARPPRTASPSEGAVLEKVEIGKRAKRVLDWGRVLWLQRVGFGHVEVVEYVDPSTTGEPFAIVAYSVASDAGV